MDLITHSLSFSKESITEYFLKPLFVANDITDIISVRTDIKNSEKLDFISKLEKITKAYAQGTSFTSSTGVVVTQKTLTVADMKAEVNQNGKAFLNWVKESLLKKGVEENDITDTLFEEIVLEIFMRGLARDFQRQVFFGDVTKEAFSGGFPTGVLDVDYKEYDGFWTRIIARVGTTIPAAQRITINNSTTAEVQTMTLSGSSAGTLTRTVDGVAYSVPFNTSDAQTNTDWVTTHAAALAARYQSITVVDSGAGVATFTADKPGQPMNLVSTAAAGGTDTVATTTPNVAPAALGTDEAYNTFESMVAAQPSELVGIEAGDKRIMCTRSMLENYKQTLRALNGSEAAFEMSLNGRTVLSFDGIPIIQRSEWDDHISADFAGCFPHRAILTLPENLVFGTDGDADNMNVEAFYDRREQENVFRAEYKAGTETRHDELIVTAY